MIVPKLPALGGGAGYTHIVTEEMADTVVSSPSSIVTTSRTVYFQLEGGGYYKPLLLGLIIGFRLLGHGVVVHLMELLSTAK